MFKIVPYVSAGPVRFGMTKEEVFAVLGRPESALDDTLDDRRMTRFGFESSNVFVSVGDEGVVEVECCPGCDVSVEGIDIYGDRRAFHKLLRLDGEPFLSLDVIILLKLGLALSGFHDDWKENLDVTAFVKGLWDKEKGSFAKYPVPEEPKARRK